MLRTVRVVEELSGERLVHAEARDGTTLPSPIDPGTSLRAQVEDLRHRSDALELAQQDLELELARVKARLGIE